MDSWEEEDNFETPTTVVTLKSNKWEGEDEEENVKESWEDEDDDDDDNVKKEQDQNDEEKKVEVKKNKKKLQDFIAEKEAKKREELERRLKLEQEEVSPEEKLRMQKESDLKIALETTFGGKQQENDEELLLGGLKMPSTKEEFDTFAETLTKNLTTLSRHGNEYVNFAENLARNLCAVMNSADIKKVKNTLDNLYLEKQKIEKGDKSKKNKGKGKAKLKLEGENNLSAYVTDYANDFDDYDDFM